MVENVAKQADKWNLKKELNQTVPWAQKIKIKFMPILVNSVNELYLEIKKSYLN